jgi:AcrR family transcriptional regulator
MVPTKPSSRSPGRGRYDRGATGDERRHAQRTCLLDATGEVLARRGFARASVRAICETAGMSRATFYAHFDGLEAAVVALHDRAVTDAFELVAGRVAEAEGPLAQLRRGVPAFLGLVVEHPDMARVVFQELRALGPRYERRREEAVAQFAAMLEAGVRAAHLAGILPRAPDPLTVYAVVGALEAVAMRYVTRGEAARALEAEAPMVELVLRAFGGPLEPAPLSGEGAEAGAGAAPPAPRRRGAARSRRPRSR